MGTGYSKKIKDIPHYGVKRADGGNFANGHKTVFFTKAELDDLRKKGIVKGYTVVDNVRYRKEVEFLD